MRIGGSEVNRNIVQLTAIVTITLSLTVSSLTR